MRRRADLDDVHDPADAWPVVVRVAGLAAVLAAVVALALQRFLGVAPGPLVAMAAAVALIVGLQLPAAAPPFLQPLEPVEAEVEPLFDELP